MYLSLREMERLAAEREMACVANAVGVAQQTECTVAFLEEAEQIEMASLAAAAAGADVSDEKTVARAAVKSAHETRKKIVEDAAEAEIACVQGGGGGECTVAFNDAWDRAEEAEREAVLRHRGILRRWVKAHKKRDAGAR
jgi:hypothetical protein|tara:strand:+ start:175 stop:594 length:420 start_codon:yes stop_codon:yes gene_type:complete